MAEAEECLVPLAVLGKPLRRGGRDSLLPMGGVVEDVEGDLEMR